MAFVEVIQERTRQYLSTVPKSERKNIGQFFTPTPIASFMGRLPSCAGERIYALDPGAGSGILTAALVDGLVSQGIQTIHVDLYENNEAVLPLLESNLQYIEDDLSRKNIVFDFQIFSRNFIEDNQFAWTGMLQAEQYDIVISNPPYKKIGKAAAEAMAMSDIVYGQPNLYFLFMAMGARLLKPNGRFVYIVPRSFASGLYFTAFRQWFLSEMQITQLHLFVSREAVGGKHDSVLQETVIIQARKTREKQSRILITESMDEHCDMPSSRYYVDYSTCVGSDNNAFLYFPTSQEDAMILDLVNRWPTTLPRLGFRMKTGLLVDFREREWLIESGESEAVPLLWAYNFSGSRIRFPVQVDGKPQYLRDEAATHRLQMRRGNYLLLKRFTSKEEKKRLQCALLFDDDFSSFRSISTENHLNFITKTSGDMHREELFGLYVVLNSSYLDRYFRILNGSTQVNANEINAIPFPALQEIIQLGRRAMACSELNETVCDTILENHCFSESNDRIVRVAQ